MEIQNQKMEKTCVMRPGNAAAHKQLQMYHNPGGQDAHHTMSIPNRHVSINHPTHTTFGACVCQPGDTQGRIKAFRGNTNHLNTMNKKSPHRWV